MTTIWDDTGDVTKEQIEQMEKFMRMVRPCIDREMEILSVTIPLDEWVKILGLDNAKPGN